MNREQISDLDFRLVVESAPTAIIITDREGLIIYTNAQTKLAFGYDLALLPGKHVNLLFPQRYTKGDRNRIGMFLKNPAESPFGVSHELSCRRENGTEFPAEINLNLCQGKGISYIRVSIADITARKQSEALLVASETRFRHTLDAMLEGAQIIDFDYRYVYLNDAVQQQSRFHRHELIGYTMMEKYPGIENTEVFAKIRQCMETREATRVENEFDFPDGTKAWFELVIQPVTEGVFILSQDITARKNLEHAWMIHKEELERKVAERTAELEHKMSELSLSEEKFNKAFHGSAAAITISRLSDTQYVEVNDAFVSLTGYSRDELIGRSSVEVGLLLNLPEREKVVQEIRTQGRARNFEMALRHKSGRTVSVLFSAELISMQDEPHTISIIHDITERKLAEQQLNQVNKELEAFSYSVSHDLRAPLRAIVGYSQMLNEDYEKILDSEGHRLLGNIRYNAAKMGKLIDDLLAFSRLGRKEVQKSLLDLNELVGAALHEVGKTAAHRATVKWSDLHPVQGDYGLIYQVILNLLSNAIKYSSKKEKPEVHISTKEENGEIIFSISDNGAGFNMKYADKLFGVFQRLHSNEEFEGTGVGLAIIQRIISKHNGRTWAEAVPGEGATFHFSLPANSDS